MHIINTSETNKNTCIYEIAKYFAVSEDKKREVD